MAATFGSSLAAAGSTSQTTRSALTARRRQVVAARHLGQRGRLLRTGHGHQHEPGACDAGEGQRHALVGVVAESGRRS